jgi:BASS family bile acid:Na+ symporter
MSYIAKADTAYSISLTTVSTLLCPLLTPGITLFLAGTILHIEFLAMFSTVILTVIVPLIAGFLIRYLFNSKIEKVIEIFPAISVTFIIFICSLVIALNKDHLAAVTGIILIVGIILNLYGMLAGYGAAKLFKMETRRRRTLAIEIGMQNAGLGSVLALKHFGPKAAMPAAIFVFICIITASILSEFWQRKSPSNI